MPILEKIKLSHKPLFREFLSIFPPDISEHTFANLYAWHSSKPIQIVQTTNALIVAIDRGDYMTILGPPLGPVSLGNAAAILCETAGKPVAAFERIPEQYAKVAKDQGLTVVEDRNNFDYVYRRKDLAELDGRRFHAKRNLIAQCLNDYDCKYEEISAANLSEVIEMMGRWCKNHECGKDKGLCSENLAIGELLNNFGELGAFGAAIRISGKVEAFTIGEGLNSSTAVVHFEKAMGQFKGLYQLINQQFCKNHLANFEYVNREQDLGLDGLRKSKTSYFPDYYVKKYLIYLDPEKEGKLKPIISSSSCGE